MKIESQNTKVLRRLQSGRSVTQMQAINWWRCTRLARVINDLRKEGYQIQTELIGNGRGKYARYSMEKA